MSKTLLRELELKLLCSVRNIISLLVETSEAGSEFQQTVENIFRKFLVLSPWWLYFGFIIDLSQYRDLSKGALFFDYLNRLFVVIDRGIQN